MNSAIDNEGTQRRITLKSPREIEIMREAGRIVAIAQDEMFSAMEPGISTAELDSIAAASIARQRARPAFLGMYGFPAVACISLNDEIVHGIPSDRIVQEGDIVSIDCGAIVDGFYSDCARTAIAGMQRDPGSVRLVETCREALEEAIGQCVDGNRVGDVSHAVESYARANGYELVRDYVGHGIGRQLHEPPPVPNVGSPQDGPMLISGMTIAVEPMIMDGSHQTKTLTDGWTVATADGSMSAHFEHTVAITDNGPDLLTVLG